LLFTLLGFLGFAGIQRFVVGQIGMGILYILTCGLCFIGTIIDLINHKQITFEHNQRMVFESMQMVKMSNF
ncbi:TM2 domain-containing protein, partial [Pedobacter sp.]